MDPAVNTKLSSSEVAFPRGGASVLTPLEMKTISNKATEDVLFEQASLEKKRGPVADDLVAKLHKKAKKQKHSAGGKNTDAADQKLKPVAHLSFKNLLPGVSVLGQIVGIARTQLSIAIGDNLVGHVPITAISDELTEQLEKYEAAMDSSDEEDEDESSAPVLSIKPEFPKLESLFSIGQWLRAVVMPGDDKKKSIDLTIEPQVNNAALEESDLAPGNLLQASVKSVEDHGIVLSLGLDNYSGFMPKKELKKAEISVLSFRPGQVVLASIASTSARTVTLRPAHNENVNKKTTVSTITSVDAIHPGAVVNALISDVAEDGIHARVFGMVDATFSLPHAGEFSVDKLKNHFAIGSTVRARVINILVEDGVKSLMLSRAPRVFDMDVSLNSEPLEAFPSGFVFELPLTVIGADSKYIYLSTGSEIVGQVHKSNTDPDKVANIEYPIGSKHRARVLGFNQIDNVLIMTLNPKVINSKFASAEDIPVGEYISSAEVTKILPEGRGLIVKFFGDFEAMVPPKHMSDIKLVYPERKFKVGGIVKGRVLQKNGRKLYVTLRKSLVNMEEEAIVYSTDHLSVGFKTTAVVEKFVAGGAVVSFFGKLKAYLPKNEISETFVENAKDYLRENQAVGVRVMKFSPEDGKISVTLRQAADLSNAQAQHLEQIVPGRSVVKASVVEKSKEAFVVELEGSNLRGLIFTGHLSDGNYEENRIIYKSSKVGGILEVLVLEKNMKTRTVVVSAKKSLINAAKSETLPLHYEDIHVGSTLSGFVKSVTNMGLFVSFTGRLTGLVLPKNASADPSEDLLKRFYKNQSVACEVIKVDNENKRFLLSLADTESANAYKAKKLKNPVDSSKKLTTDFACGETTNGIIESIEGNHLKVRLADNFFGRVHASQYFSSADQIKDTKHPLASVKIGESVKAQVVGYNNTKTCKFTTSSSFSDDSVVELSILKKQVKSKTPYKPAQLEDVEVDLTVFAYIDAFDRGHAIVSLAPGVVGEALVYNLSKKAEEYEDFEANFPIGACLKLKVQRVNFKQQRLVLSAGNKEITSTSQVTKGQKIPGMVFFVSDSNVLVEFSTEVAGRAFITDALGDYDQKLSEAFKPNQPVLATVLEIESGEKRLVVSLRNEETAKDKAIRSIEDLKRGKLVKGFVKSISNTGIFVALNKDLFALVRVSDISDVQLSDWKKYYKPYQCVVGKIAQCQTEGRISMSLKESEVNGDLASFKTFEELEVDQIYDGSVKQVAEFGVFVRLDGTANVSGLCHRSEVSDNKIENVGDFFSEGDRVKVKILKIDTTKRQLSLGMKASYFMGLQDEDVEMSDAASESEAEVDAEDEVMDDAFESDDDSESEEESTLEAKPASQGLSGLSTNGFDWTASILDQAEDDESSDDDGEDFTQKKKRRGKGKKQVKDRTLEMNSRAPESVGDFERLLVGNPDSSVLWMNYMSFQLQLSEIDKSREIAERALKTINYREEQEKMNIWIAILNLENTFGTDESLAEAFQRSVQYMDSLIMHQKLIGIYVLSEKFEKAEELFRVMCKKFSQNVAVWVQCGSFYMDRDMLDQSHEVLARALQSLPKRDHIDVVRKFGQLEFAKGDPEQGRSLFEGLITDAPKRTDLWNVYIDQEIKTGDRAKVEALFERVVTKKLSRKQAKFFFSKWLSFEAEAGDEQAVARVKALAVEFVQKQAKDEEEEEQ
ncbi:hypothetical protein METBIDRAFT_32824 [Metschnikowia bicuspidata var. bicuspidata NRRL YB-4993]|uniref:rRNA biogenesis protein RRP5 n=1 Tax=Metschnikowia bicuspidata var. bicuspidata NRRL YB-4993 TaxID=869754 RepID=A0A1A0H774_9ASCO|nr:hypothetical protein METBIDRAFT_32824 [Metschnikowia bicuspidata var. bicuspidata NRRL YB-4993]OBA19753.1 hypothetical protein METBIDRAFT_32824 [Metschnikowia bicuspidata var. bicuspidata NRRL YB-4993]